MAEKLEEAASPTAAAMEEEEACFSDEILLDFTSDPPYAAVAGELQDQAAFFQDFFDTITDDLPGLQGESGGGEIEEEELEWISNKDAFPALETSFEIPAHSRSSSGSGSRSGGGAVGERPSPFWVMAAASFSVPARPRSKGRMRRPRVLTALTPAPDAAAGAKKAAAAAERRRCQHCLAEETPQWRAGPEGPKTLCNACGVRYKSGRLVPEYRPASSPTFSAAIHSNSHRRILEMRRQKTSRDRRSTRSPALVTPPVI